MNIPKISYLAIAALLVACNSNVSETKKSVIDVTEEKIASSDDGPKTELSKTTEVTVPLMNASNKPIGTVTVSGDDKGSVKLAVSANAIPEGAHGMHFHENGSCIAPDFKSAGGHINPMNKQHGLKNPEGPDNADMENAVAPVSGILKLERTNTRVSMTGGGGLPALLDNNGSALVIHENPDDQVTQPIGGAGARIACAEIIR